MAALTRSADTSRSGDAIIDGAGYSQDMPAAPLATKDQIVQAVRHLSPADQVDVFLALRDGLPLVPDANDDDPQDEFTDVQKAELRARIARHRADPDSSITLEEFEAELARRFGGGQ